MAEVITVPVTIFNRNLTKKCYEEAFEEINKFAAMPNVTRIGEFYNKSIEENSTRYLTTDIRNAAFSIEKLSVEGKDDDLKITADIRPYAALQTIIDSGTPLHYALRGMCSEERQILRVISVDVVVEGDKQNEK